MYDDYILKLWNKGYSIDYITKDLNKYINKDNKPYYLNGTLVLPKEICKKSYCRGLVYSTLYNRMYCKK